MQVSDSHGSSAEVDRTGGKPEKSEEAACLIEETDVDGGDSSRSVDDIDISVRIPEDESVIDISGQKLDFPLLEDSDDSVNGLYFYKNEFNLIPRSIGKLGKLRKLKLFGNDINLFPPELGNLVGLEYLQVKMSSPGFGNGWSLDKLKGLKELELTKVPRRSADLTILSQISGLQCLTRLSVCHFSIRYLPPEIGCLKSLEFLDLSFNKIKSLPCEIGCLSSLIFFKVAHNKLVELPQAISLLQQLESLDLSYNRLVSLDALGLCSMRRLKNLNLQYNKLSCYCPIPTWISCNLEGNYKDVRDDECSSCAVEMDVYEVPIENSVVSVPHKGCHRNPSNMPNNRCFSARRSSKRWKRKRHYFQQRARHERLNNSRKWKSEIHSESLSKKDGMVEKNDECSVDIICADDDDVDKQLEEAETGNSDIISKEDKSSSEAGFDSESCQSERVDDEHSGSRGSHSSSDHDTSSEIRKPNHKWKRYHDEDLDNPKRFKCQRPSADVVKLTEKYSTTSFCSSDDHLPDGFYDAGRDRPFMTLSKYEEDLSLDSREVILMDREKDEELDAITLSARAMVVQLKQLNCLSKDADRVIIGNLQIASLLALFVSDHFGGSDRSNLLKRTRKTVSGRNYHKPFICTCLTGNKDELSVSDKQVLKTGEDINFTDICEKALRSIKLRQNSIVVPLGKLQFGVCRHRALLMKYICDRLEPPVPCELVRGYLDFMPHAWNIIPVQRGDSCVRMVVDACHPHYIREETDPEFFCRYVPLSRLNESIYARTNLEPGCSFPSLPIDDGVERANNSSLVRCKLGGSTEVAVKMRTLEVCGASVDEIRTFEYSCLGEVRILGSLQKHDCIVELYGHQISSKWITSEEGMKPKRILQSSILMEYVKGGSLKGHIKKLSEGRETRVPMALALSVARDISGALLELHRKHIIHRDIKSENVVIDLDEERADGTPVVKLCDFDRAVPLRSYLHRCCIAHVGIPSPDVCVGTPRWMAPEVIRAMHKPKLYGLEVDIWSFGCLIFEMLTLKAPYHESSEHQIHEYLQKGKRPKLPDELEALRAGEEGEKLDDLTEADLDSLRFLMDVFRLCTEASPEDRPNAGDLHDMILSHVRKIQNSA